ncbi:5'-nucleotidase [Sediminihabitans luteus]|nr:5'-nucleotidase [Sediminihabitans luteus]
MASMRHAFGALGLPVPDDAGLRSMVGPPLQVSIAEQGVPDELSDALIDAYRAEFRREGMLGGNSVFPGVPEALDALRAAGLPLAVATSKPQVFARQIAEHFDLARHMVGDVEGVFGADMDGGPRATKAAVIEHALTSLAARGLDLREHPQDVVMVGDRSHDVHGAAAHGIATVGVAWGYAEPGELEDAGAVTVVRHPDELAALIA